MLYLKFHKLCLCCHHHSGGWKYKLPPKLKVKGKWKKYSSTHVKVRNTCTLKKQKYIYFDYAIVGHDFAITEDAWLVLWFENINFLSFIYDVKWVDREETIYKSYGLNLLYGLSSYIHVGKEMYCDHEEIRYLHWTPRLILNVV